MLRKQELDLGWLCSTWDWIVLSRNPNCNRGCKTVAQHLASAGLEDIIGGLFGA